MDDFLTPNNWFKEKFRDKSGERYHTFKAGLNLYLQRRGEIAVETGTQSKSEDWESGCSTTLIGSVTDTCGSTLYTVDNVKNNLGESKKVTQEYGKSIKYMLTDSVEFLGKFDKRIDFLYLDSWELPKEELDLEIYKKEMVRYQRHCLKEIETAWPRLHKDSIVLFDDYDLPSESVPKLAVDWLRAMGWKIVLSGQQCLMISR